jgi:hypothetical protein
LGTSFGAFYLSIVYFYDERTANIVGLKTKSPTPFEEYK